MFAHVGTPPPRVIAAPDAPDCSTRRPAGDGEGPGGPLPRRAGELGRAALAAAPALAARRSTRRRAAARCAPAAARADRRERRGAVRRPRDELERLRRALRGRAARRAPVRADQPASPGSARRGWRASSRARAHADGATCSTAARTPSRSSPTSRSSARSSTTSPTSRPARSRPSSGPSWASSRASSPRCAGTPPRDAARRRSRDAPLPALRGGHARARPRRARAPDRADPRRPPVGGHLDVAAARPRAAGPRAGAAARARHDARERDGPRRCASCSRAARASRRSSGSRSSGLDDERDSRRSSRAHGGSSADRSCAGCATAPRATRSSSRRRCAASPRPRTGDLDQIGVPEGVKEMIARRLARLDETANQVLAIAAVVGRDFRLEVLEALIDRRRVSTRVEEAVRRRAGARGRRDVDRFLFAHALVRETLYEQHERARGGAHCTTGSARRSRPRRRARPSSPTTTSRAATSTAGQGVRVRRAGGRAGRRRAAPTRRRPSTTGTRWPLEDATDARRCCSRSATSSCAPGDPAARAMFRAAAELARDGGRGRARWPRAALGFAARHARVRARRREAIALLEEALAALGGRRAPLRRDACSRGSPTACTSPPRTERTLRAHRAALAMARGSDDPRRSSPRSRAAHRAAARRAPRRAAGAERGAARARPADRRPRARGARPPASHIHDLIEAGEVEPRARDHAELARARRRAAPAALSALRASAGTRCWPSAPPTTSGAEQLSLRALELGQRAQVRAGERRSTAAQALARPLRMGVTPEIVARLERHGRAGPGMAVLRAMLALALRPQRSR